MKRGDIWRNRNGCYYLVVSDDGITEHSGFIIGIRLVAKRSMRLGAVTSSFVHYFHSHSHSEIAGELAITGLNLEVLDRENLEEKIDQVGAEITKINDVLRAVMAL